MFVVVSVNRCGPQRGIRSEYLEEEVVRDGEHNAVIDRTKSDRDQLLGAGEEEGLRGLVRARRREEDRRRARRPFQHVRVHRWPVRRAAFAFDLDALRLRPGASPRVPAFNHDARLNELEHLLLR